MPRMVFAAWWLFGSTILAALVLRWRLGDELFLTRYTGYVMPWLLVLLVPGAATAWLTRRRLLGAVLGTCAVIVVVHEAPLFRPRSIASTSPADAVRVMSYNTWSSNTDTARIAQVILRYRPDVLLLQEIPPEVLARLAEALRRPLYGGSPVYVAYDPELLQAVVSRHPVASSVGFEEKGNAQKVVLRSPEGPITIFNVHPPRWGGWRQRYTQIAALLEEDVLREIGPVILGGDFNAPDHSQLYALVSGKLDNAHAEGGFGFGFTFPASLRSPLGVFPTVPLVRIDHIFHTRHFATLRAGTLPDAGGSDHRPIHAELVPRAVGS